ncbi:hypothetical protein VKA52_12760 [Halobacillus sp. HZG1]|uniref:hypothetical protein n=1 Tax=Halobacillus sp. HZG1 TaxID=3111769 RepID=UPI002DBE69CB|nr:hypothetical protein [Halobacillus sp. HZG1]MEC3884597.1 hypothetical protein [Halobacillus sp. HZG1]
MFKRFFVDKTIIAIFLMAIISIVAYGFTSINLLLDIFILLIGFLLFLMITVWMLSSTEKEIKKYGSKDSPNLYDWAQNLEGSHHLLNRLLKDIKSESILSNMHTIKNQLERYVNHNLENTRMLRAYFIAVDNHNLRQLYFGSLSALLTAVISLLVRSILSGTGNEKILNIINMLGPFTLILFCILTIVFLVYNISAGRFRVKLIINILDQIIETRTKDKKKI